MNLRRRRHHHHHTTPDCCQVLRKILELITAALAIPSTVAKATSQTKGKP